MNDNTPNAPLSFDIHKTIEVSKMHKGSPVSARLCDCCTFAALSAVLSAVLSRLIAGPGPQSLPALRPTFSFGRLRRLRGELVAPGLGEGTVLLPCPRLVVVESS